MKHHLPIFVFCLATTTVFAQQAATPSSRTTGTRQAAPASSAAATQSAGAAGVTSQAPLSQSTTGSRLQQPLGVNTPVTEQGVNIPTTDATRFPVGVGNEQGSQFPGGFRSEERGQFPEGLTPEQRGQLPAGESQGTTGARVIGRPAGGARVGGTGITDPSGATIQERSRQLEEQRNFTEQLRGAVFSSGTNFLVSPQNNGVITVISQNGIVTLQGTVASPEQRLDIEERVRSVADVAGINNQILVLQPDGTSVLIGNPSATDSSATTGATNAVGVAP